MTYDYDSIMERLLANISDSYDKREGSVIWDALSPCAIELNNMWIELQTMQEENFGDTASREYLIRLCKDRGITPTEATKSILKGVFTPDTVEIPIGTRFNSSSAAYVVTEKIEDGTYKLECETAGSVGNSYIGTIIPINYIEGLETASISSILIYGEDIEDTEHLRARYMASFSERSFSGNKQDYIDKCTAISGVGACKVESAWNGGGTVRLTILDSEYGTATDTLVSKVKNEFDPNSDGMGDGLAPIGHVVTVRSAEGISVAITTSIVYKSNYTWDSVKTKVEDVVKDYLLGIREEWQDAESVVVRISQIESRILSVDGIADISKTAINGNDENLELTLYQVPVFGSITDGT